MERASACGQVCGPKASLSWAAASKAGSSPSAPPITAVVNNALPDYSFNGENRSHADDLTVDELDAQFRGVVGGALTVIQAVLPGMRERHTGTVVMVGSMLSSFPVAFRSNYAATKSALKAFALASRRELAPYGIRMISVEPGTIATGIGDRRSIYIGENSPYRDEYETLAAATRHNEEEGISGAEMAAVIVDAALAEQSAASAGALSSKIGELNALEGGELELGQELYLPPVR